MKILNLKYLALGLTVLALGFYLLSLSYASANASESTSYTSNSFTQFCTQNPTICKKVTAHNNHITTVTCPNSNQIIDQAFVHTEDGETLYKLPDDNFNLGYIVNVNQSNTAAIGDPLHSASGIGVTANAGTPDIDWVGIICQPSINPTPTIATGGTVGSYAGGETTTVSNQCYSSQNIEGYFEYSDNHRSSSHVVGHFYNHTDSDCTITIHVFGSNNLQPETDNWLESQTHITSQSYTIPALADDYKVEFDVTNTDYCWYQVDVTRTTEVKNPPYYNGTDMIDYVFVQGTKNCECSPTPTPTTTPTPTSTPAPSSTPTPTQTVSTPTPTPAQVLGVTTFANTGGFSDLLIDVGIALGTSLTLYSLWRQFRKYLR